MAPSVTRERTKRHPTVRERHPERTLSEDFTFHRVFAGPRGRRVLQAGLSKVQIGSIDSVDRENPSYEPDDWPHMEELKADGMLENDRFLGSMFPPDYRYFQIATHLLYRTTACGCGMSYDKARLIKESNPVSYNAHARFVFAHPLTMDGWNSSDVNLQDANSRWREENPKGSEAIR